jgi:leucyl-tRNA synthetase
MPYPFAEIEPKWQQAWEDTGVYRAADPGETNRPGFYALDMFPYPSGAGLHVGHPEGYTATDIVARYKRMKGFNVLHPMGWDAFGLPAEQYAIKNNVHPVQTTARNVETFKRQIRMLGLGYDWSREVNTTDAGYYRWTQWIFLQIYNSYFDPIQNRAMPVSHLHNELFNGNYVIAPDGSIIQNPTQEGLEAVAGEVGLYRKFEELDPPEQRDVIDAQRLAYVAHVPVNWCPELGTTLSNEEVVDGRSEIGGHPVERRPLRQWMLRITAYADRLLKDLDALDWSESLKDQQRNWIGRSTGAAIDFELQGVDAAIEVYTTRPDTLFGATYMVLAPEHELVDRITTTDQRAAVSAYVEQAAGKSERDRQADAKDKTGVFTGAHAINPVNGEAVPVWIADYVLTGYGTGAIMAVPAHDERDFAFATKFDLPIRTVVESVGQASAVGQASSLPSGTDPKASKVLAPQEASEMLAPREAFVGEGEAVNSGFLDGLPTPEAKAAMIRHLEDEGVGRARTNYKLRDWLFSRQRYWGEPFPILLDADGNHHGVNDADLPVSLPELADFKPTGSPEGPLAKAGDWLSVDTDQGRFTRETNTMPQWAGSCWYYLRYLDPDNAERFVDPEKEAYWMPVDLYVGGAEHAVLHLLYARFWHKVLYDLGHVSTREPFAKLVNQGMILGETEYTLSGERIESGEVEKAGAGFVRKADGAPVEAKAHKMSKSRGNVINPDDIVRDYGADVFRLYEMYMGPLEAMKPWNTRDIVGMSRFLNKVWRTFAGDEDHAALPVGDELPADLEREMNRRIKAVGEHVENLRFNTAIAELIEFINGLARRDSLPRPAARAFLLLLSPFAPHIAEELWRRVLGIETSIVLADWPEYDEAKLAEATVKLPVQVNGKVREVITVAKDASKDDVLAAAKAAVADRLADQTIRKVIHVPGRMVNFVV